MKKEVGSTLELSASVFLIGQVPIDKYGLKTLFFLLHTVVVLHFTHHIQITWLVIGGNAGKMLKNNLL